MLLANCLHSQIIFLEIPNLSPMEEEIRCKINNNLEYFEQNHPELILWTNGKYRIEKNQIPVGVFNECIICENITNNFEIDKVKVREDNENIKNNAVDYSILSMMSVFKLLNFNSVKFTEIQKETENNLITPYEYSKAYIKFIEMVDYTNDLKSIKFIDLEVFYKILCNEEFTDEKVKNFIKKAINDPICYKEDEKQGFIVILLLSYVHGLNHNLSCRQEVRKRLINIIFMFKPTRSFNLKITKDFIIDKYIIMLKAYTGSYHDASFLNYFYLKYLNKPKQDKNVFSYFQTGLIECLKSISNENTISFLKYVFLKDTVLFTYMTNSQLLKMIFDFYKKIIVAGLSKSGIQTIAKIAEILQSKIADVELNKSIAISILDIANKKSLGKSYDRFSIRLFENLTDFIKYFEDNYDSYEETIAAFNIISEIVKLFIKEKNNLKGCINLLELIIDIFDVLKSEYIYKIFMYYLELFKILIFNLSEIKDNEWHNLTLYFNRKYWRKISKIILSSQRFTLCILDSDKKKKKSSKKLPIQKKIEILIEKLIMIENELLKKEDRENVILLSVRGFKIEGVNEVIV